MRKAYDLLEKALLKMKVKSDKILTVFGSKKKQNNITNDLEILYLGHISDPELIRIVYSAADVIIIPSRQENLSNVVLEALSCGTPAVAFNIGGMPDMIIHKKNGYLAKPFDTDDLLFGIEWILYNNNYNEISKKAHHSIKNKFDNSIVTDRYIEVYKKMISEINLQKL